MTTETTAQTTPDVAREIAILIATASIEATYADCDDPDADQAELDDEWHAKIGYHVIDQLAADGYTIAGPGQVAVDASALRQADSWGVFVTIWNDADTDAAHKIAAALAGADAKGAS